MELKPGYKQTEVGVIPEDWEVKTLGEVASFLKGKGLPKSDISDSGKHPCIHYGELFTVYGETIGDVRSRTDCIDGMFRSAANDVLMPTSDVTPRGLAKASCIGIDGVILGGDILVIRLASKLVYGSYLSLVIRYEESQVLQLVTGTTVYHLYGSDMKQFTFPLPPLPEQKAIAKALSDMDSLLGGLDSLIAKKRDVKQATMQQLLTGKTRLPGFSGDWEVKTLGEVASFLKGKGLPKSDISDSGKHPCIHYGELFTVYGETIGDVRSRTDCIDGMFRSAANDVLMPTSDVTPRGLAKASCIGIDGVILGGDILVIRLASKLVYGSYLSLVIRYEESQVLQLVTGTTVYHLYGSDMKKFTFPLPPLPEQKAIAKVITDMDAELDALEQRRDKTRELKQAMMQELLTGRTRLV